MVRNERVKKKKEKKTIAGNGYKDTISISASKYHSYCVIFIDIEC
jgi:hypothetical protein